MERLDYKKIPKFTNCGHYAIHEGIDFLEDWIKRQGEIGLQLNPDFQRGNVWTEDQQIKYVEFLLRGGESSRDIYFNQPGWMNDFKGEFVCVDGLQRLTAVLKFEHNELPVFEGHYRKDIDNLHTMDITLIIHINNLKTRKEVLKWYLEFNTGGTVHTEEELNRVRNLLEKEK